MSRQEINRITGAGLISLENNIIIIDKNWISSLMAENYLEKQLKQLIIDCYQIDVLNGDYNLRFEMYVHYHILVDESIVVDIEEIVFYDNEGNEYQINLTEWQIEEAIIDYLKLKLNK